MGSGFIKESQKSLENIIERFSAPDIKVISFDFFDTLVVRPIERPEDLFELLDEIFGEMTFAQISFKKLRVEAEAVLRRRIQNGKIKKEDITLDDIYEVLKTEFYMKSDIAEKMKQWEISVEYQLCMPRNSGKYLYEKAISSGKEVIILSDMYLEKEHIKNLLKKNGFTNPKHIFVSSNMGKRKITGHIYESVLEDLGIRAEEMIHIGDHRTSDVEIPGKLGIKTIFFEKTLSVYEHYGCAHQVEKICADLTDWEAAKKTIGIGIMRQLSANKYFDNPFRKFDKKSDYNKDPYFVGYAALGMELLALVRWISENAVSDHAKKIIFMARDGYLPRKAYEIYRSYHKELPKAEYLLISRRAVLPLMIQVPEDLFDLPVDLSYQTPRKLLKLLSFCLKEEAGTVEQEIIKKGFFPDKSFTKDEFQKYVSFLIREKYDEKKHEVCKNQIREYLRKNPEAPVTDGSVLFDSGYSGRIPAAICHAIKKKLNVYYIHTDPVEHFRYERRSTMNIRAFFDFSPYMEATLREYAYLEPAASCIGYSKDGEPVFDEGPAEGYGKTVWQIQKGALDFVKDFMKYFSDFEKSAEFRNHEAAMPFEAFLRFCSIQDRKMYEQVLIDDELWGGRRDIDLKKLMESRRRKLPDYAKDGDYEFREEQEQPGRMEKTNKI